MSTKTLRKRIALVAVSALGFGVMSAMPSTAADAYTASFTAPSSQAIQTTSLTDGSVTARDLGSVVTTLVTGVGDALKPGTDTVTVTIDAQTSATNQAKNDALKAKLSFGVQSSVVTPLTPAAAASASNDFNFASTGQNALNNAIVSTSGLTMLTSPNSAAFTSAIGRAYVKLGAMTAAEASAASGGTVTFAMTLVGGGKISTFTQTMTITFGTRLAGVATVPTTTGTITAGGTATFAYTAPYTAVRASDAWTDETFTLGGTATGQTFSVTGVTTGGSVTLVRTSATTIEGRVVKSNIAGTLSTAYSIVVTAPATATSGQTVTVATSAGTWSVTVQPYTPVYASSEVSLTVASNGYYAASGDAILWGDARVASGKSADLSVVQKDQTGATITQPAFAKTVTATITGRGSLSAVSGADVVVKSQTWSVTNSQLTSGTTAITVFPDGVSGEGTLAIAVDGVTIKSYTMRFFGDATSVTATLLRPVGSNVTSVANGVDGGATNAAAIAGITTKSVTATTAPAIAVVVKDANGYAIPTATAPIATSSNLAVVSVASHLFVDSGISDLTALKVSAGTFVQHYSYTTVANAASGSSSSLTFNFVNRAGTSLASTPIVAKVGGEVAKTVVTFNKAAYAPGEAATITFTSTDAAGNAAFDGQDVLVGGLKSTLAFTGAPTSAKIVGGVDVENVYAPASPGTWTITDVTGKAFTATATVTNIAAEAKAAGDAATAAANAANETAQAATDAAAEATDAANAATDAANAAAEAADAATAAAQDAADAVAALSTQVSEMVDALKKQITALTNLVIKIQKKVKA